MAVRVFLSADSWLNRYHGYHQPLIWIRTPLFQRIKIMLDISIIGKLLLFLIGQALQACIGF